MNIRNYITAVGRMAQKSHFIGWGYSNKSRIIQTYTYTHALALIFRKNNIVPINIDIFVVQIKCIVGNNFYYLIEKINNNAYNSVILGDSI